MEAHQARNVARKSCLLQGRTDGGLRKNPMKTIYEVIWSIVGLILISWFFVNLAVESRNAVVPPYLGTPAHQKQTIDEFLNDHPDIKQRVDELKRQAERDAKYNRS